MIKISILVFILFFNSSIAISDVRNSIDSNPASFAFLVFNTNSAEIEMLYCYVDLSKSNSFTERCRRSMEILNGIAISFQTRPMDSNDLNTLKQVVTEIFLQFERASR